MNLESIVREDLGIGIGLRVTHFEHILSEWPALDWFEILSENFMHTEGRPLHVLDQVAERYPIVMHGVSMNIGSVDPVDRDYLAELKRLRDRCGARFVSDHICWTGVDGTNLHDLMPMPYTAEALHLMTRKVNEVQDYLEAPLVLENPSTYLEYAHTEMRETEFLRELAAATGCGYLMDVNNVFVCASNHGYDAAEYLREAPWDHVAQFHLAGHSVFDTHRLDTHDGPACDEVWELYRLAHELSGGRSTLFEWDDKIPSFDEVRDEAHKAKAVRQSATNSSHA